MTTDYRLVILELLLRPESSPEAALKLGRDGWNPTKKMMGFYQLWTAKTSGKWWLVDNIWGPYFSCYPLIVEILTCSGNGIRFLMFLWRYTRAIVMRPVLTKSQVNTKQVDWQKLVRLKMMDGTSTTKGFTRIIGSPPDWNRKNWVYPKTWGGT